MEFLQEITLELNSNTAYTTVGAKQGDSGSRVIKIHITENGRDWKIPDGVTASYRVRKPDGYAIWNDAVIPNPNPENVIYVTLTEQTLAAAGRAYADVLLLQGNGDQKQVLSTVSFIIIIMASPDIADNITSSNEFSRILDITDNANVILNEAEAWAMGTKSGVPVIADYFLPEVVGGSFTIEVNETVFRSYVGESKGYTRYFIFTCMGIPEGEHENHWNVSQGNTTLTDIDLADYGITITHGTPLQSNTIRITVTDSDIQYENNAKYYAEQAKESREAIENLGATAEKIYADDFQETKLYKINDYVWYQGLLYKYNQQHSPGAWNPSEVTYELTVRKTDETVNAQDFSSEEPYYIGDYVIYNEQTYKFIMNHNPGSWDSSEVIEATDEIANLHFKLPQGPTGDVYFMTFDIDIDPDSATCGNLMMYKPDRMSPQVDFKRINSYNNDGELYFEILN